MTLSGPHKGSPPLGQDENHSDHLCLGQLVKIIVAVSLEHPDEEVGPAEFMMMLEGSLTASDKVTVLHALIDKMQEAVSHYEREAAASLN